MAELTLEAISNLLDQKLDEKLKGFATKSDLSSFATKDDLYNALLDFPTKAEFRALQTTVNEIKETVSRIDRRTDQDIRVVYKDIADIKEFVGMPMPTEAM